MADPADPSAVTEAAPFTLGSTSLDVRAPVLAQRYELVGLLGAGAMGTVYRARDRELDEIVALKVLNRELAAAPSMLERFRREVKLARRVTHRNVARTFDIGEHGGDRFLTMEYVDGEMLGARLARVGRLPPAEAVRIAIDLAAGLGAAHAAGVIHRDLKPANAIIASDGRAVITDFGIARAFEGEPARTAAGGIVGTPAYMAPEQVEGAADLDARADLYALGVMLYELLTGQVPWSNPSPIAAAAARLLRPPPDPRERLPRLAPQLAEAVLRLMARSRENRFATAEEASGALSAIALADATLPPPAAPNELPRPRRAGTRSIAVLPIVNRGAPDDEYLAQTLTEDLVDQLSLVPELRVRPSGDVGRLGAVRDVREAGRALRVDVVVEGSLRRAGDDVRVVFRLVTVDDGFQLWAHRFDQPAASVLAIADEAASAIARALEAGRASGPAADAVNPAAQELYLRGRFLIHGGWRNTLRDAVVLLRQAHELAPDDPRIGGTFAYALARAYSNEAEPPETGGEAHALAEAALLRNPAQPEARVALGVLHLSRCEGAGAIVEVHRALALAPNDVYALEMMARLLGEVGRPEAALELFHRALAIDPAAMAARHGLARVGALLGEHELFADRLGQPGTQRASRIAYVLARGRHALWTGDTDEARRLVEMLREMNLPEDDRNTFTTLLLACAGEGDAAHVGAAVERLLPLQTTRTARRLCFAAQVHVEMFLGVGAHDEALRALRVGEESGLLDVVWLDRCPILERIREHPTFGDVRRRTAARAQRVLDALDALR